MKQKEMMPERQMQAGLMRALNAKLESETI